MAASTLVSTLPFGLREYKPGLFPSIYEIPPAPRGDISVITIHDGFHLVTIPLSDEKAPPLRLTDTSEKICEGLIRDYVASAVFTSMGVRENGAAAVPGFFWKNGEWTVDEVKKKFVAEVAKAKKETANWFELVVKVADDDWQANRQYKMITEIQRAGCAYLGLKREWNFNVLENMSLPLCWSCKMQVHPEAIICSGCKAILNKTEYEKRKTEFAATA